MTDVVFGGSKTMRNELRILWAGLSGVFRSAPKHADAYTMHVGSGWIPIVAALLMVSPAELVLAHILLDGLGGPWLAWGFTSLTLYGLLWMWGDAQAMRLNPTTFDEDTLNLRVGLRWRASIPLEDIVGLDDPEESDLPAVAMGKPELTLVLRRPSTVLGPFGTSRVTERIGLRLDDRAGFEARIDSACGDLEDPR